MPRYAVKGGDVILKCDHSVPPEQLYKVEWQKGGNKLFQYIKGRKPPFIYYQTEGSNINVSYTRSIQKSCYNYILEIRLLLMFYKSKLFNNFL